jgi:hypothetical protein
MSISNFPKQFHALFSIFMVVFYLGVGVFLMFFSEKYFAIDKAIRVIIGTTWVIYGTYRIFVTYKLIIDAFFTRREDDE